MKEKSCKYSVVVPLKNEEGNISILDKEIKTVMKSIGNYETIYVNDGSTDGTLNELKKLKDVKILNLNRCYGQATALNAGFRASKGEIIITMDGDLQNDPKDISRLLKKLETEDLDVVTGWREKRKDKRTFKILTRIGMNLRRIVINDKVHDTGCTLRVYKKSAVNSLDIGGEMHRYILAILRWKGFKIGELIVNHRARINGKTKYGASKAFRGFIDLLYIWFLDKYSQRPLHIFGTMGLFSFFLGILIEGFAFFNKIVNNIDLSENAWFLLGFFLIIGGFIAFSFGIVIDLLIRIHLNNSPYEKRYYIREVLEK